MGRVRFPEPSIYPIHSSIPIRITIHRPVCPLKKTCFFPKSNNIVSRASTRWVKEERALHHRHHHTKIDSVPSPFSRPPSTQLTSLCRHVPLIYDTVDIHFLREARDHLGSDVAIHAAGFSFAALSVSSVITYLDSLPADSPLAINQAAELDIIKRSSATLVVSSTEVDLLRHYAPQVSITAKLET